MLSAKSERVQELLEAGRVGSRFTRVQCPFCEDEGHRDRKLSLSFDQRTGWWKCFRCDTKGRIGEDEDFSDDQGDEEEDEEVEFAIPEEFVPLAGNRSHSLRPARTYLRSRGLSEDVWKQFQLHACCEGWYAGRVIIPHLSVDRSRWLGFISRIWAKAPPPGADGPMAQKYLYPKGMRRDLLYNHTEVLEITETPLLLVEGSLDTIALRPHSAAFLGEMSEEQYEALLGAERPLCVVLDGDAWIKGHAIAIKLQLAGARAGSIKLPAGADPDEYPTKLLMKLAKKSIGRFDPIVIEEED